MKIAVEIIESGLGFEGSIYHLCLTTEVIPDGDYYRVYIAFRDPWIHKDVSRTKYVYEVPTDSDYGHMIVHALQNEHPNITFTWDYDITTHRITIHSAPNCIRSVYGTTIAPPSWHEKSKEKPMNKDIIVRPVFNKVVINGPATIGWRYIGNKKFVIKKADYDTYDLEKAFLMLYAKSQFDNDEEFHKWFKVNMKMFKEAYNESHPDIGELPVVDAAAISKNINASLDRMSKALHNYKDRLNSVYGKAAVDDNIIVKKSNKWTEEEEDFLRRRYKTSNLFKLSMVLGRSEAAIKSKAHRLGLDKKEE